MVFSSSLFLVYFLPVFLILYFLSPAKGRNFVALVGSIIFYAWGAPKFLFVVFASLLVDFHLVGLMASKASFKRSLLWLSVMLNVGMLGYFKYANFFIENVNSMIGVFGGTELQWTKVVLPIGISFFTFQKLSYTIDVYRGKHRALSEFGNYALYIILFPQLIAGPIVRFTEIADRIEDRTEHETVDNRLLGFFRFCIGLSKKVLVANVVGQVADTAFALPEESLTFMWAWTGLLAYSMQIYFDFSGYSDMAIGLGRMMGFTFPENFNSPYISSSITEFWQRWHMTLGRWMKDYLYIPLGGNKVGIYRTYVNLWIVFFVSGLWHGASWNFVIWGAYHGLFLVLERMFLAQFYARIGRIASVLITFIVAILGWVIFRVETLSAAITYYRSLFSFSGSFEPLGLGTEFYVTLLGAISLSFISLLPAVQNKEQVLYDANTVGALVWRTSLSAILFIFCLSMVNASGFNPFIYFQF